MRARHPVPSACSFCSGSASWPGSSRRSRPACCRSCRSCSPAAPPDASRCGSSPGSSRASSSSRSSPPGCSTSSACRRTSCATSRSRCSSSSRRRCSCRGSGCCSSGRSRASRASAPAAAAGSCSASRSGSSSCRAPGPVLAAVTVVAAEQHVGWRAILLTLAYALGAALPMLLIALGGREASARLRAHAEPCGRLGRRDRARRARFRLQLRRPASRNSHRATRPSCRTKKIENNASAKHEQYRCCICSTRRIVYDVAFRVDRAAEGVIGCRSRTASRRICSRRR